MAKHAQIHTRSNAHSKGALSPFHKALIDNRGYVADPPTCGPLLILSHSVKR